MDNDTIATEGTHAREVGAEASARVREVCALARAAGFECVGTARPDQLAVHEEVRAMCAANRCQHYGTNWVCPPACESVAHYQNEVSRRSSAIVVQTVGQLEDSFDFEGMMEIGANHTARFRAFADRVRELPQLQAADAVPPLFLGAGQCTSCPQCTYPDAPCRFPERAFVSLEAAGFVVSEVCNAAGIPYNHGQDKLAYTGAVFV